MYKSEVKGKGGIVARVVAKSADINNPLSMICTMEVEYPRFIHAECKTHRIISDDDDSCEIILKQNVDLMSDPMLSRNAASSRAIPVSKIIEQVDTNPAMPIHWGKNQKGMSAEEECNGLVNFDWLFGKYKTKEPEDAWRESADRAVDIAKAMSNAGYHKQIVNRILEPYQFIKVVVTSTEWDNFFYLRDHKYAQPEIQELARCMKQAIDEAEAELLSAGEWHTPYVNKSEEGYWVCGEDGSYVPLTLDEALKVSASCCAQVSYRLLDNSLEKAVKIYDQLVESKPVHASPFEHQATPMECPVEDDGMNLSSCISPFMDGATHTDRQGNNWSGNLKGFIQHRQLIKDNVYKK